VSTIAGVIIGVAFALHRRALSGTLPSGSLDTATMDDWYLLRHSRVLSRGTHLSRPAPKHDRSWRIVANVLRRSFSCVFTTALFGIIHLDSGIVVAIEAVLLGLIAGELRRMSGSLIPGILFHALLNAASALWPPA
jgi:hypothetical protein